VVFLKGPEESILIYSMKEWEQVLERTKSTLDEEQSRLFMHFVVSEAGTSEIDKAGRILIPGKCESSCPWTGIRCSRRSLPSHGDLEPSEWRRYVRAPNRYEQNMAKILNLL
jgi:MraZ protein